jgi:hypothetical protein
MGRGASSGTDSAAAKQGGRGTLPFALGRRSVDVRAAAEKDEHSRLLRNYEAMALGWFWATDAISPSPSRRCWPAIPKD